MQTQTERKTIKLQDDWSKDQVFKIGKFTITVSYHERIREQWNDMKIQKDILSLDIEHNNKSILHSFLYGKSEI